MTLVAIALVALLCARSKVATARSMVVLVLLFCVGIGVCFVVCMAGRAVAGTSMVPAFVPGGGEFRQVVRIGFLSPWAFIGFESVSHSAAEYRFEHRYLFRVLVSAASVVTALYVAILVMSVSAYPEGCSSWLDYITRLDEFEGIEGLPAFYAAYHYMGDAGVYILMASLMALVVSSLIGMLRAVSRLCFSVAQDGILPARFAELSDRQIPVNAILLAALVSLPVPFLGRTTIGWIVDTTTIGATIVYGFSAVSTFKAARQVEGATVPYVVGAICLPILVAFLVFLLLPGVFADHTIETETYALLIAWSLAGLVYFNWVIRNDHERRFGKALIVWVAFLAFVVLVTTTLSERLNEAREDAVVNQIDAYIDAVAERRVSPEERVAFLAKERKELHDADSMSALVAVGMFGVSVAVLAANYVSMRTWKRKAIAERDRAHEVAFTDPLTDVKSKHAFAVSEGEMETRIVDGEAGEFGVVVCDVNGLKRINDTLGHKAGDEYIRQGCRLLCEHFKHSPVFRVGGDEFVVLLRGHDFDGRHEIMAAANAEIEGNVGSDRVVISLGLADYDPANDASFHDVFQRADGLMYERKMELKGMGAVVRD